MKIALTGGTGFVGKALREALSAEHQTYLLVRKPDGLDDASTFVIGDQYQGVEELFRQVEPDVVIHLAACYSGNSTSSVISCNVELPAVLLEMCSKYDVPKFIYAGSYWQYGSERNVGVAVDLYSASKSALEPICDYYAGYRGVACTELVLYGTYGSEDPRAKLPSYIRNCLLSGEQMQFSPGDQTLNLVHVEDVCSAFVSAIRLPAEGSNKYGVFSNVSYTIKDLIAAVEWRLKREVDVKFGVHSYRANEIFRPLILHSKLPGWTERHCLIDYLVGG